MKDIVCIAILLFSIVGLSQQQGSVSGNIVDREMNGEPLMFAHVEVQHTDWQTDTNLNGNFEITGVTPGDYMLAISFSGYETKMLPITVDENSSVVVNEELSAKSIEIGALVESAATDTQVSKTRAENSQTSFLDEAFKSDGAFKN